MDLCAIFAGQKADFGDRLNNAGFIVGQHHRNQHLLPGIGCRTQHGFKGGQINDAIGINRNAFRIRPCLDHRGMFDRTGKYGDIFQTVQGQIVGLGTAACENHTFGITTDQIGNFTTGMIDNLAGRTTGCMNR